MRPFIPRVTCVAAALALVACRESSGPQEPRQYSYAIFNADVTPAEPDGLATSPVGFFFRAPALDLPDSRGDLDACQLQRLVTPAANLPLFIGAGDSVAFAAEGGSTVYLKPRTDTGVTAYRLPGATVVPIASGATVTFTVPGATDGFPASSIAIETVAPYEMSPVPDELASGQAVTLTWSPAGGADSRMDIAFLYATSPGGGLSEQLYCSLVDDGEHVVSASFLAGFRAAANGVRQFSSRRWRTAFKDLDDSVMLAISSYAAPSQEWP